MSECHILEGDGCLGNLCPGCTNNLANLRLALAEATRERDAQTEIARGVLKTAEELGADLAIAERWAFFWERCNKRGADECWPWTGTVNPAHGYGEATIGPRGSIVRWRAHRLSYELFKGPVEDGMVVMHACDNRVCVNPRHLSVGTVADNNMDMTRKGRGVVPNAGKPCCKRGHPLNGPNLYVKPNGNRQCRTCVAASRRKYDGV